MAEPLRRFPRPASGWDPEYLSSREWLVTNGLGGYASSTLAGVDTRSYHGLLTAALPAPLGRLLLLKQLSEHVTRANGREVSLTANRRAPEAQARAVEHLDEFRLEAGMPVWSVDTGDGILEKRVVMPHRQNTTYTLYDRQGGKDSLQLTLRPWVHFRPHESGAVAPPEPRYTLRVTGDRYEIAADTDYPVLRLLVYGDNARFVLDGGARKEVFLPTEAERGYHALGSLWSPGYFVIDLAAGQQAALVASCEAWNAICALRPQEACDYERERRRRLIEIAHPAVRAAPVADLVLAADQFLVTPAGRVRDAIQAHASGDQVRSIIAGYHWFSDWGRDTMISLEGLTLTTGRHMEAGWILRTFAHYVRDGLLPNMFPEGQEDGLYHTADATLWFFHALDRYVAATRDRDTLQQLLPILRAIITHHMEGTRFGIGVDPRDGLLHQGAPGYQLTWMDAKVEGWVVTPRRGKAVEINALWYNALRLMARWVAEQEDARAARVYVDAAERTRRAFNERFWYAAGGYLYDVIDGEEGDDTACRPNQLFAVALPHAVLDPARAKQVVDVVRQRLLTPVGLRSLAPEHPQYKPRYFGDLRTRDAAYHQGTVWAWLIGPFVDAWLALYPDDRAGARRWLEGMLPHLDEACVGSLSEIFDAEEPFTPRGCVSQAWSVAEVLRCWLKTE